MSIEAMLIEGNELKDLSLLETKEWLVTNGIGGYASGSISGILTRKYHGLLVASVNEGSHFLLFPKVSERVSFEDKSLSLSTDRWEDGSLNPNGYKYLREFKLEGSTPVWIYKFDDYILEKRVWMEEGEDTTYLSYYLSGGESKLELETEVFINFRNHQSLSSQNQEFQTFNLEHGCAFLPKNQDDFKFYAQMKDASYSLEQHWYNNYKLSGEEARNSIHLENHLRAVTFKKTLAPKEAITLVLSRKPNPELNGTKSYRFKLDKEIAYLEKSWTHKDDYPGWLRYLDLASRNFFVKQANSSTPLLVSGYPWQNKSTKDILISLSGLTINNPENAKKILKHLSRNFKNGLLPCKPNETSTDKDFANADCSLLFFNALHDYYQRTSDLEFIRDLFIQLDEVVHYYVFGTLNKIKVDPQDGLLEAEIKKTFLSYQSNYFNEDASVSCFGKTVEINALWYNALMLMADWSDKLDIKANQEYYLENARKIRRNFLKFWNVNENCLLDIIDSPNIATNPVIGANQVLCVSLPYSPILLSEQKAIVQVLEKLLLTPFGLKVNECTVSPYLLGHFAIAHYKVFLDKQMALGILEKFAEMLQDCSIGNLSEVYKLNNKDINDKNNFTPEGCISFALSTAEALRAYRFISEKL